VELRETCFLSLRYIQQTKTMATGPNDKDKDENAETQNYNLTLDPSVRFDFKDEKINLEKLTTFMDSCIVN